MKILVFTFFDITWLVEGSLTGPNKREYAELHGYNYYEDNGWKPSTNIYGSWRKYLKLRELAPLYDWIFVTEADSIITNKQVKLEQFCDNNYDLVCPSWFGAVSLGNFLFSGRFLDIINELEQMQEWYLKADYDESALNTLIELKPEIKSRIKYLPIRAMNSVDWTIYPYPDTHKEGQWQSGDFMLHLLRTKEKRIDLIKKVLKERVLPL